MKPDTIYKFVQELKRRRVFRGIVVYGASTLVLFEAATNLAPLFGKESVPTWFAVMLGVGFFISLWFSWIYDITPGGIRKTEPASEEKVSIPKKEVRTYQTTTFVCVLIIIGLVTYNIIDNARAKQIEALDKSIAVLPYHDPSLSPSQTRIYEFVGQELTSCLWKVEDYRLIPWDECRSYMRRNKKFPEVGEDLKVCILVQWKPYETGENRHLSIELISAQDADLIWSETYAINGSWADEVRRLSNKISKKITRKLRIYLTPQERALIDEQKRSAQASLLVSLGNAYTQDAWKQSVTGISEQNGGKNEFTDSISFSIAVKHFTDAIQEDPTFAEAYANRAKAKLMGKRAHFYDSSVLDESWEDIEKAFDLDPNLPEASVAMGFYYYYGVKHFSLAALSFEKAYELDPTNCEYQYYLSKIFVELENWRRAQVLSNRVLESNPQNALFYTNLGLTFAYLNENSKALHCQDRAIDLMPRWTAPYINKAYSQAFRGKTKEARTTVRDAEVHTGNSFPRFLAELDLYDGDFASAVNHIELANDLEFKNLQERIGDAFLIKAKIYKHAGSTGLAKENYSLAADYFLDQISLDSEDPFACSKLALAYAGLGKDKLAIENGQKAYDLGKKNYSAFDFPFILHNLVLTYTIAGDNENALYALQELLETRSLYTLDFIKTEPDLKPLLNDPEFKNLNP